MRSMSRPPLAAVLVLMAAVRCRADTYLGPLVCSDPSCPVAEWGRPVNNSNFHIRDVSIVLGGDDYFYLTGTSTMAGDSLWSDVWGVVRMWRSKSLVPGSFVGGQVRAATVSA